MEQTIKLVVFKLFDQRFALKIQCVDRIVPIVEINSLPNMPDYISGVINLHGEVIPVINMHILFNLQEKKLELSDQLIIVNNTSGRYALWVDNTNEVIDVSETDIVNADDIVDSVPYIKGILKGKDGLVFINDTEKFLSPEELSLLNKALRENENLVRVDF